MKLRVALGFDGSDVDDWTALKAETIDGHIFTPRYGPDSRPTIWNPAEWGGRIPRVEVDAAVREVFATHDVGRMYCDPPGWQTEIETWALEYGAEVVIQWATYRIVQMHAALDRFVTDLTRGAVTHDGCPVTAQHMGNARMLARPGGRYVLGKASQPQKIDAAMATVLAHEAAADLRAEGWGTERKSHYVYVG